MIGACWDFKRTFNEQPKVLSLLTYYVLLFYITYLSVFLLSLKEFVIMQCKSSGFSFGRVRWIALATIFKHITLLNYFLPILSAEPSLFFCAETGSTRFIRTCSHGPTLVFSPPLTSALECRPLWERTDIGHDDRPGYALFVWRFS